VRLCHGRLHGGGCGDGTEAGRGWQDGVDTLRLSDNGCRYRALWCA
jgi:hypothetical protein